MLRSLLRIENFYWVGDEFCPSLSPEISGEIAARLTGQFALCLQCSPHSLVLLRDRLGINKLFYALSQERDIWVSNYLADLIESGIPLDAISSVPAGGRVHRDCEKEVLSLEQLPQLQRGQPFSNDAQAAQEIRSRLELWFARLARQFRDRPICLCLSGGLDSGLIASLTVKYFTEVVAYTYSYCGNGVPVSEDARSARRLADLLKIPLRNVTASADDINRVITPALIHGQDWREFNVHCAIVNELLAEAIASDFQGRSPLILTGDLMNEFMADYSSVTYEGKEYYSLPELDVQRLRLVLIRGLDAGDREIGVFNHHGLRVVQPYNFVLDQYLRLSDDVFCGPAAKQNLVNALAGDLLPSFIFQRKKVRAQIGDSDNVKGILPVLIDGGIDAAWLRSTFARLMKADDAKTVDNLIRMGIYRYYSRFPTQTKDGFYVA